MQQEEGKRKVLFVGGSPFTALKCQSIGVECKQVCQKAPHYCSIAWILDGLLRTTRVGKLECVVSAWEARGLHGLPPLALGTFWIPLDCKQVPNLN